MKKYFLFILSFLAMSSLSQAQEVSGGKALKVAENFFGGATRGGGLTLVWDGTDAATRSGEAPAFYVFNRDGGGFVIVSGDESNAPILAYSYHDSFGNVSEMPENLNAWMAELRSSVADRRARHAVPSDAVTKEWNDLMTRTRGANDTVKSEILYPTGKWQQLAPFNNLEPMSSTGSHCKVGCTSLSFCQIMHYWKWPKAGTGTIKGYSGNLYEGGGTYTAPTIELGHEYDWDNILLEYNEGQYTDAQATAVATLCRDVAIGAPSSFGVSATSGSGIKVLRNFQERFDLSKDIKQYYRTWNTVQGWNELMRKGLAIGPVYYMVFHSDYGHAIVLDGIDANDYQHFNWGWGGISDGYYLNSLENPNTPLQLQNDHYAFIGVKPNDGKVGGNLYIGAVSGSGISLLSGTPAKDSTFTVKFNSIYNGSPFTYKAQVVLAHCDKDNNIKSLVSPVYTTPNLASMAGTKVEKWECRITEEIEFGDRIALFSRTPGDEQWEFVQYSLTNALSSKSPFLKLTSDTKAADATTVNYNGATGKYGIRTLSSLSVKLYGPSGDDMSQLVEGQNGSYQIDSKSLAPGKYRLVVSAVTYKDVKELIFNIK